VHPLHASCLLPHTLPAPPTVTLPYSLASASWNPTNPQTLTHSKTHKKHIEFQIAAEQQQQQQLLDGVSHSSSTVVREYLVPQQEKKHKVVAPHVRIPQKSICFFFTNGAIILRDLPSCYSDFLQLATAAAAATATASRYTQQSISFVFPYNPHQGLTRCSSFAIKAWHGWHHQSSYALYQNHQIALNKNHKRHKKVFLLLMVMVLLK
jgi:hypothetical protein